MRTRKFIPISMLSFFLLPAICYSAGKSNPDISVNFLGLAQAGSNLSSDRTVVPHNGLALQEAELQFLSDVDPYLRANALFSISQESGKSNFGIDPEEVFFESISLPSVTVRAGKFKMALGKHNQLHTHAYPFIDAPLINQNLLGEEGLNELGVSVATLVPLPWFSEFVVQGYSLSNEAIYNANSSGDIGSLAHYKNLWDLSEDSTLEFGVSGAEGKNSARRTSSVLGADLTLKWKPAVGGKYQALLCSAEFLNGARPGISDPLGGLASWIQYQFAERWWVQGRYEYLGLSHSASLAPQNKQSALLGFFPSEFSGLRLQVDHIRDNSRNKTDNRIALQYNITIGAHPAHAY